MTGYMNSDGSALVGGLLPSGAGQALQLDASGNLKTAATATSVDTFEASAPTINAATTFSGIPTVSQLVAGSYASLTNPGAQASFLAALEVTSAFVGTLGFYGLEPDGATLTPLVAWNRSSGVIASSTAINAVAATNQVWQGSITGFKAVYVVCTNYSSGSITAQLGLSAAPIALVLLNGTALGQALMASSQPVVIASDQSALPIKRGAAATIYSTTQSAIAATGVSGDLAVGQYTELLILVYLSAFTGTSINFRLQAKDAFGNYMTLNSSGAQSATGFYVFGVGAGCGNSLPFGDDVQLQWQCTSVTSATFQATVKGK